MTEQTQVETISIEELETNVYRVHVAGELHSRIVSLGGHDSPSCDGQERWQGCDGQCQHVQAVELVADYDDSSDEPEPLEWEPARS